MCILFMSRNRFRKMQDELSELRIKFSAAQDRINSQVESEKRLTNIIDGDRSTINELNRRIETLQRIIDKLNNGTIKPNPNHSSHQKR